jgi:integrase
MNHQEAIAALCDWCKRHGYLDKTPQDGLAPFDTTPQTIRRAMTPEEIRRLLEACAPHRRLVYQTALLSGLRANELRNLTVEHLDRQDSGLHLDPTWTKNRKAGFQNLPGGLVEYRRGSRRVSAPQRTRSCTRVVPEGSRRRT